MKPKRAILVLEDGTFYKGLSCGEPRTSIGEIVFTTGITGYQEILTDPSYCGQLVVFTYPEIGNTGVNYEDNESTNIHCRGVIVKNLCKHPSSWRMQQSLLDFVEKQKIVMIYGIDTRKLTKHLRQKGAMNGCISNTVLYPEELLREIKKAPSMAGLDLVSKVTTPSKYQWTEQLMPQWRRTLLSNIMLFRSNVIVVLDYGVKYNILRRLASYGCSVVVLPATSNIEQILACNPTGVMLSNGPGDPSAVTYAITTVKNLIDKKIPLFGICMGHQILCLALGAKTFKLKFGHRGINHPTGVLQKVEITSQNHGFSVDASSWSSNFVKVSHYNLNDWTVAGIIHQNLPIFSVQYHPEASPGPHDADYFFDVFLQAANSSLKKMNYSNS